MTSIFGVIDSTSIYKKGVQVLGGDRVQHAIHATKIKVEASTFRQHKIQCSSRKDVSIQNQPCNLQSMPTCLNSRVDQWQQNETNSEQDVNMSRNNSLGFRGKQQWRGLDPSNSNQDQSKFAIVQSQLD